MEARELALDLHAPPPLLAIDQGLPLRPIE